LIRIARVCERTPAHVCQHLPPSSLPFRAGVFRRARSSIRFLEVRGGVRNEARGIERESEGEREAGARPEVVSYSREAGSIERVQRLRVRRLRRSAISSKLKQPRKSVRYHEVKKVKAKAKV
jgi:hypothetical protein